MIKTVGNSFLLKEMRKGFYEKRYKKGKSLMLITLSNMEYNR